MPLFTSKDGAELNFSDTGSGPPLVLSHGWGFSPGSLTVSYPNKPTITGWWPWTYTDMATPVPPLASKYTLNPATIFQHLRRY